MEEYKKEPEIEKTKVPKKGTDTHSPETTGAAHNLSRDFQQCGILTSVDSEEPLQPPLKLRNSKRCSVSSLTAIEYSSD